jgi:hypothetical protein
MYTSDLRVARGDLRSHQIAEHVAHQAWIGLDRGAVGNIRLKADPRYTTDMLLQRESVYRSMTVRLRLERTIAGPQTDESSTPPY